MKKLLLFLLLSLLLVSCKKEKKEDKQPPQPAKVTLVSKNTHTEKGSIYTINYTYDSKHRLINKHYSTGLNNEYTYDATGNVIKFKEYHDESVGDRDSTVYTFVYQNGLPKTGVESKIYKGKAFSTGEITYEVSNNRVTKITLKINKFEFYYSVTYDAAGNMETIKSPIGYGVSTGTYSYSDKKNPFYNSRPKFLVWVLQLDFYSPNNVKSTEYVDERGSSKTEHTTTFDANGFPTSDLVKGTETFVDGTVTVENTTDTYEYITAQ